MKQWSFDIAGVTSIFQHKQHFQTFSPPNKQENGIARNENKGLM